MWMAAQCQLRLSMPLPGGPIMASTCCDSPFDWPIHLPSFTHLLHEEAVLLHARCAERGGLLAHRHNQDVVCSRAGSRTAGSGRQTAEVESWALPFCPSWTSVCHSLRQLALHSHGTSNLGSRPSLYAFLLVQ